jgi:error-prone DNA polymerase
MQILIAARDAGFVRIPQLLDAGVPLSAIENLADTDAFRSMGLDRRKALWEVAALTDHSIGLFHGQPQDTTCEKEINLPEMSVEQHVIEDYRTLSLSLKAHPVSFVRDKLSALNILATNKLIDCKDGMKVRVAGLVLVRQRPGTASGICFVTIEDEMGNANLVVFENLFTKYRKEIVHSHLLMVEGKMQKEGEVIHVVVQRCYDLSALLIPLSLPQETKEMNKAAPEDNSPVKKKNGINPMQTDIFHGGRDFH